MSDTKLEFTATELLERVDAFWLRFLKDEKELVRKPVREQVEELNEVLEQCLEGLALEMSAEDGDLQVEMTATAHGEKDNFPLLMDFVKRAPSLSHYNLTAFRARVDEPDFGMNMEDFKLATSEVLIGHFADNGRVGIEVLFDRELPSDMKDHAENMTFIMLDHVLGEFDFAIKVGVVDFVSAFSDQVAGSTNMHKFASVLDSFWVGALGHTGLFPTGEHDWTTLKIEFKSDGEGNESIVSVNDSANAIAARPDLGYAVELKLPAHDHDTLDTARNLQNQIATRLELHHVGILSHTVMRNRERLANYYVGDLPAALKLIKADVSGLDDDCVDLRGEFDPSWSKYFRFAG